MPKAKPTTNFWQAHLDELDDINSADQFFINGYRRAVNRQIIQQRHDLFSEPLVEQTLAADDEGQLSLDVFQTPDDLIIQAVLAGVEPQNLDINIDNDVLTIRGRRENPSQQPQAEYFYQECYWGGFSRSIILPAKVQAEKIKATLKNGLLTIIMPRAKSSASVKVRVKTQD